MELIRVHEGNIDREHICCAINEPKGGTCISSKKSWMKERFDDGLVFCKLDARGKAFIEYIPAEKAWNPITAPGYMHINCLWVSGQFAGKGNANRLLDECIADAKGKGKAGLSILSAVKKMPFLCDPGFLKHRGFHLADTAKPFYELLYLPFDEGSPAPEFRDCAREGRIDETGMVLYYTNQCPYTDKYAALIQNMAENRSAVARLVKLATVEQAQNAPCPFTTYSFFFEGRFLTNEIFGPKKFEKFLDANGF